MQRVRHFWRKVPEIRTGGSNSIPTAFSPRLILAEEVRDLKAQWQTMRSDRACLDLPRLLL